MNAKNLERMRAKEKLLPFKLANEWFMTLGEDIFWKKSPRNGINIDEPAGFYDETIERFVIRFKGKPYLRSRLIWLLQTGAWPKGVIDHINRIKQHDSFDNLRDVSYSTNRRNVPANKVNRFKNKNITYRGLKNRHGTFVEYILFRIRCEGKILIQRNFRIKDGNQDEALKQATAFKKKWFKDNPDIVDKYGLCSE